MANKNASHVSTTGAKPVPGRKKLSTVDWFGQFMTNHRLSCLECVIRPGFTSPGGGLITSSTLEPAIRENVLGADQTGHLRFTFERP